jgi:hypothetical protein
MHSSHPFRADLSGATNLEAQLSPMKLLESGIPLSLLLDLVMGPQSADLLDHERSSGAHGGFVRCPKSLAHRTYHAFRTV